MPPRLRILAGPSTTALTLIEANTGIAHDISSDVFQGKVAVYLKNFANQDGKVLDSSYFEQNGRRDLTWSIQVQGRFLQDYSADDILFGNVFDRPLNIPWGFSSILSFMQYVDPTLEQDLVSKTKPWALSPFISTMPYLEHTRIPSGELHKVPPFPPLKPIGNDISHLRFKDGHRPSDFTPEGDSAQRRQYFRSIEKRKETIFGPEDLITADFAYGYITFSSTSVSLQLPGGFSMDLMKYWDGQPVYFVCCERGKNDAGQPTGKIFWCVAIEILDEDDDEDSVGGETGGNDDDID